MNIFDYVKKVKNGELSALNTVKAVIKKCKELNKEYNCFVNICEKEALESAKIADREKKGLLCGVPVTVKDAICVKDVECTAGSRMLKGYVPPFDATIIEKLKSEGAIIIGKTTQDEFGFGSFSTNSAYGVPKNPYDKSRSCGGSSGGSACITALADFPHISIGESTGGSISCPAFFCGVYGLTPTYGLVSRYGLIDYANSIDKMGPMAKSVDEIALALKIISGNDEKDQTSLNEKKTDYLKYEPVRNYTIGLPKQYFENISIEVKEKINNAIEALKKLGIKFIDIDLKLSKYHLSAYYLAAVSEASTNLAKLDGIRYGAKADFDESEDFNSYCAKVRSQNFGDEAKRRIIIGTFARMSGYRSQYYLRAMKARTLIINDYKKAFEKCDALLSPTMMFTAPRFDEIEKLDPLQVYQSDLLTVGPNLAGIPMINIPCGFDSKGLPIGFHLISNHLNELKILSIAKAYEGAKK
ncbi:MAG: Asp-tRNA(Asn)/Glu-tRNA(Gln) amidotransferase subunit GatA [Candidatus Nanoarchaeia archaeon]|nr:Asp-tRNA(Asn)/Glu-tRNA(Gln) amidotransferase subunit GatA [Candidatus Nanoarchaeia archaeon]